MRTDQERALRSAGTSRYRLKLKRLRRFLGGRERRTGVADGTRGGSGVQKLIHTLTHSHTHTLTHWDIFTKCHGQNGRHFQPPLTFFRVKFNTSKNEITNESINQFQKKKSINNGGKKVPPRKSQLLISTVGQFTVGSELIEALSAPPAGRLRHDRPQLIAM